VSEFERGDQPNTKADVARTSGEIIIAAREQRPACLPACLPASLPACLRDQIETNVSQIRAT
jgi:hypothetical protein